MNINVGSDPPRPFECRLLLLLLLLHSFRGLLSGRNTDGWCV